MFSPPTLLSSAGRRIRPASIAARAIDGRHLSWLAMVRAGLPRWQALPAWLRVPVPVLALLWLVGLFWAGLLGSGLLPGSVATDIAMDTATAMSAGTSGTTVESAASQAGAGSPAIELLTSRVATLEAERARLDERLAVLERGTVAAGEAPGASLPAADVPEEQLTPGLELHTGGRDLYNCHQFASWDEAQAVLRANAPGDPNHIDADGNGIACEALRSG